MTNKEVLKDYLEKEIDFRAQKIKELLNEEVDEADTYMETITKACEILRDISDFNEEIEGLRDYFHIIEIYGD